MKYHRLVTYVLFLGYGLLCIYFYTQRALYVDPAAQLFKIVNFERVNVEASRYTSALPDFLPLLLVKLNLSLRWVTMAYSVSFALAYFLIALVAEKVFRFGLSGLLVLLCLTTASANTFFHSSTETHIALAYCILFLAWIFFNEKKKQKTPVFILISSTIIIICYFAHPVSFFIILFILFSHQLNKKKLNDRNILFLYALTLVIFSLKMLLTNKGGYEGGLFSNLSMAKEVLLKLDRIYTYNWFVTRLSSSYLPLTIAFLLQITYFLFKKKWAHSILISLYCVAFILITIVVYHRGDSNAMLEKSFMPLSFIIFLPIVSETLSMKTKYQRMVLISLTALVVFNLATIVKNAKPYIERQNRIISLLDQLDQKEKRKGILSQEDSKTLRTGPNWAISIETLIYSSLDNPLLSKTVFINKYGDTTLTAERNTFLYVPWNQKFNQKMLNAKYFNLPNEPYINLNVN